MTITQTATIQIAADNSTDWTTAQKNIADATLPAGSTVSYDQNFMVATITVPAQTITEWKS